VVRGRSLGYGNVFDNSKNAIEDDHIPFLQRDVPATDIIDFESPVLDYWHTSRTRSIRLTHARLRLRGTSSLNHFPKLKRKLSRTG